MMKAKLKSPLRKAILLQCSILIHLLLLFLFNKSRLNLRYRLKASLFNQWESGTVVNLVSPQKPSVVPTPVKDYSVPPPKQKRTVKAIPAKPPVPTPLERLTKAKTSTSTNLKDDMSRLAYRSQASPQPKITDRQHLPAALSENRIKKTVTLRSSSIKAKQSTMIYESTNKKFNPSPNLIARKELSIPGRKNISPKPIEPPQNKPTITSTPTKDDKEPDLNYGGGTRLIQKLAEMDSVNLNKEEKASTGLKSIREKPSHKQLVSLAGKKSVTVIKQADTISKERNTPQPTRRQIVPKKISYKQSPNSSPKEIIASNPLPDRPHSRKPAYNTGIKTDSLDTASLKNKIAGEESDVEKAIERRYQEKSSLSAAKQYSPFTDQKKVRLSPLKKEYEKVTVLSSLSRKSATTDFSRVRQLAPSIHLDIAEEIGIEQTPTVDNPTYKLQGSLSPGVKQLFLKVNDNLSSIEVKQGNFQTEVSLKDGLNQIEILAFSSTGQTAKQTFSLLYAPPPMEWEHKFEPAAWTTYIGDNFSTDSYVYAIALDKYNNKWFGMNKGVVKFNGSRWSSYTSEDGLISDRVYAILPDRRGHLWFGTEEGVSRFDRAKWTNYTTDDGLVDNRVNAIVTDGQGRLWFGTGGGVSRFDGTNWVNYTTKNGLVDNRVNAIVADGQGRLWFGTEGGVSRFDGTNWVSYTTEDGLIDNRVTAVVVDEQGQTWFGTKKGASRFDGTKWVSYTTEDGLVDDRINAVVMDEQNRLWFCTQGGVSRFDDGQWFNFDKEDGLASNEVYAVLIESNYRKWFGTDLGVSELNEEVGERIRQ